MARGCIIATILGGAMVGDPEAIAALKRLRTATGTASPEFVQAAAAPRINNTQHSKINGLCFIGCSPLTN